MKLPLKLVSVILTILLLSGCGDSLWGTYQSSSTTDPDALITETLSLLVVTSTALSRSSVPELSSTPTYTKSPSVAITNTPKPTILYEAQSGDSLAVVANHFGVKPEEITSPDTLPETGFIDPGTLLFLPNQLLGIPTSPGEKLLPDSEIVFGPGAVDFNITKYTNGMDGYLSVYRENIAIPGWISGAGSIEKVSFESSINPRFLLAYLQYKSGWVFGDPVPGVQNTYPLGYNNPFYQGLYQELRLLVQELDVGFYGWRDGTLTTLQFPDGMILRIAPDLNAGTVALQYLLSLHMNYVDWLAALDPEGVFLTLYTSMFGDPWVNAALVEPSFPPGLNQPYFSLPFNVGIPWTFTGGPHPAWEKDSALAALDFAPPSVESGCVESTSWVVAIAPGQIVRSADGYVILDLDGDGFEQTGWVVLYLHIGTKDRVPAGTWVNAGDHIGHPSCEGGIAYGTHLHIARKYNGEWVGAGGPLPFILSGWTAHQGETSRYGTLTKGDQIVLSSPVSIHESVIIRQPDE